MNQHVRSYLQKYIEPNTEIIKSRSLLLSLNLPFSQLPDFINTRFEDIKLLAMIGSDTTVMKLIPNFLEELLISILVSNKTSTSQEFYSNQRKIEQKKVKDIYEELKISKSLSQNCIEFCERYFGKSNTRNKEIHNKEIRIFEGLEGVVLIDPETGERNKADDGVLNLIKSSPDLLRNLNHNDRVSRVQIEVLGLFSFVVNNIHALTKLKNLPDLEMEKFLASQPKSKKILITLFKKGKLPRVEQAIKENPFIINYKKIGDDSFEMVYIKEISATEASYYFLPVTNGEFKIEPI